MNTTRMCLRGCNQLSALFLFLSPSVAPSHRRTVAFIAIACRENQYCKIKRKTIKQYKILIINILINIIIYNNIIYFYSIVSFLLIIRLYVRTGLMRRCDGATVRRKVGENNQQLAVSNEHTALSKRYIYSERIIITRLANHKFRKMRFIVCC